MGVHRVRVCIMYVTTLFSCFPILNYMGSATLVLDLHRSFDPPHHSFAHINYLRITLYSIYSPTHRSFSSFLPFSTYFHDNSYFLFNSTPHNMSNHPLGLFSLIFSATGVILTRYPLYNHFFS